MKKHLNNHQLKRQIGLFSATVLVVANMIGTGIFATSGFIMEELGNPHTMLFCWLVGGLFALCGALCYGELGAMFPKAGGEYTFLKESFGKAMGFLSGWVSLIVGFSAPIAAASVAFSTYFYQSLPVSFAHQWAPHFLGIRLFTLSPITLSAVAIIVVISVVHYHSLLFGSRVQNGLTILKVGLIVAFVLSGLLLGDGSMEHFSKGLDVSTVFQSKFSVSLIFISFAYSGWNAAAYLGGEIKKPRRNIPLALFIGTFLVTCLYLLLNIVYIFALPAEEMSGVLEIAAKSAAALFGDHIGTYISGAISIALLSVLSAMIMTGPRVYYAMAKDGVFFELFGKVNQLHRTPAHAIFLQATIAIMMVLTASFDTLLIYIGFTLSLCAMLTVLGMIRLRVKKPDLRREYKTFGYPVTPLVFVLGNLWIIYFSLKSKPMASLVGLGTIGIGVLVYFCFRKKAGNVKGLTPVTDERENLFTTKDEALS